MTFGERLYKLRSEKNVSQEELAELLDVSRQSISKWENDKAYPEMTRLLFMSDYFDVSLDYLMRGVEDEEHEKDNSVTFKSEALLAVWKNFVSNLSAKQRKKMMLLYVVVVCAGIAVIYAFMFGAGYVTGELIQNLIK
jgi:transcriptional regulator with XRE-family HTH domain